MLSWHSRRIGALVAATAVLALGACGAAAPPHVASLGTGGHHGAAGTTTTRPAGSAAQLLDEWASCMRAHGDPNQVDPTVNADKVIELTLGNGEGLGGGPGHPCSSYMNAAQTALRGGQPAPTPDAAAELKFAQCMRANGIPDYPDPNNSGQSAIRALPGSDLDPANPKFQSASAHCAATTGGGQKFGSGTLQPGDVEITNPGGKP